MVELEGIEPSSVKRLTTALRPFPSSSRDGWLTTGLVGLRLRLVFPRRQWSFPPSAVFPAVNLYFCCRAVVVRPRAPLLVTVSLYYLRSLRRRERSRHRRFCWCPV